MTSDYNLTKLFLTKIVTIYPEDKNSKIYFHLKLKVMRDFYENPDWNLFYHVFVVDTKRLEQGLGIVNAENYRAWDYVSLLLFTLGQYDHFSFLYDLIYNNLEQLFPEMEIKDQKLIVNNIIMTPDIWDYVIYLLKLSYGEKVEKPLTFTSEEARKFFLAQQEAEAKIRKIQSQKGDEEGLIKAMLSITYKFPSLTFDYLFEQTMAQIRWLQKMAAGAVSYEVNAQAFAAGNTKKGKKLDFFIK